MAKRSRDYSAPDGKEVWKELENIHRFGYGYDRIFSDWLDLILSSLLSLTANMGKEDLISRLRENRLYDEYNSRYLEIVGRYRENKERPQGQRPIDYHVSAWGKLTQETQEKQRDILGQIFTDRITFGEAGQYFTPDCVTDMMAMMAGDKKDGETVMDPCCGSGRFLLSMARQNPNLIFYGQDVDHRCAKMAAINMWLFDLNAFIKTGGSLGNKWSVAYEVRQGGYMWERKPEDYANVQPPIEKPATLENAGGNPEPVKGLEGQLKLGL